VGGSDIYVFFVVGRREERLGVGGVGCLRGRRSWYGFT